MNPRAHRWWGLLLAAVLVAPMVTVSTAGAEVSAPGQLLAWGADDGGQVGDGAPSFCDGELCHQEPTPVQVTATANGGDLPPLVAVSGGRLHAIAVDDTGTLWNWGDGNRLPFGATSKDQPWVVDLSGPFVDAAAGTNHTLALHQDGTVWAWGLNERGQLGRGFATPAGEGSGGFETSPEQVLVAQEAASDIPQPLSGIVAVAAGITHSLALDAEGRVWSWGGNAQGQLGNGDVDFGDRYYAGLVTDPTGAPLTDVVAIAAGQNHSLALTGTTVWSWGDNRVGQLGIGEVGGTFQSPLDTGHGSMVAVAASDGASFFLRKDGVVLAVGSDVVGERGDGGGNQEASGSPSQVLLEGTATRIVAGGHHAMALMDGGGVQAWGDNTFGQLGVDPAIQTSDVPLQLNVPPGVVGLGAGAVNGYAIHAETTPPIANLALTVDPVVGEVAATSAADQGPIGVPEVDLAGVDISTLPMFDGDIESLPLRANPLRANPLRANPLRANPLRANPLRANPLRANPLRANPLRANPLRANPLRANAMPAVSLAQVPLLLTDSWADVLAGNVSDPALLDLMGGAPAVATPFAGLPLHSVFLQQVLDLPSGNYPQIDALTLEFVDVTSTPLRTASIQTFLFSGPSLDQLSSTHDWCGTLLSHGFDCAGAGIDEATSTLMDLHFAGAPVDDLWFLPGLAVDSADLDGDAGDPLDVSPAYNYDVAHLDPDDPRLAGILVSDLPPGIVDCTDPAKFDCTGKTLGDAILATQGTDVEAIVDDPSTAVFGRLLDCDGSLPECGDLFGWLTLSDVARMLLDPTKLVYADLPLAPLAASTPVEGNLVQYTASADVACSQVHAMTLQVQIPGGFRYQSGSASLDVNGLSSDPGDPREFSDREVLIEERFVATDTMETQAVSVRSPRESLTWDLAGSCGEGATVASVALRFLAQPWIQLGTKTSGVALTTPDGSDSIMHTAPFAVQDAGELVEAKGGATTVSPGTLYLAHLGEGDTSDRFEVTAAGGAPLTRGTLVTAVLGHLPADYDLEMDGPSAAPLRANPLRANPLRANPLRANPIEDDGLPGDGSGLVLQPDLLQDVPRFDLGLDGTEELLSISAHDGLESEVVSAVVTAANDGEPVTLNVSSYLGDSSEQPYTIQVFIEEPPVLNCTPTTAFSSGGTVGTLPPVGSVDPDARTLVLINEQRLSAQYGDTAVADIRAAFAAIDGDPEAGPFVILPVDGDAAVRDAYTAWDADPCEPELGNDVVRGIASVMDPYLSALPNLRFTVVVGDHYHIPSYATPDTVTLANQRMYHPELVFDGNDNPLSAAAGLGYVHTDHVFGDLDPFDWLDHELLVPELAVGRLVETPQDIIGSLEAYALQPFIDIDSTLVSGYDFLLDGAKATNDNLVAATTPSSSRSRLDDAWGKTEILADFAAAKPDAAGVNGHFDHSRFLTAKGDAAPAGEPASEIVSTTEMLAQGLSDGMLLFTVGCNAGVSVPALAALGTSAEATERLLDFAEMTAGLKGTLFANLGFGYGDTELNLYSERLMTLFADKLDGSMTIGQAAVSAQHDYLAELGLPGAYDYKILTEATVYGLPFLRIGSGGQVDLRHDNLAAPAPDTSALTFDTFSRQRASTFDLSLQHEFRDLDRGDYYTALDPTTTTDPQPEPLLISHYRPVQPEVTLNLPEPDEGTVKGDVLITGLTSTDHPLADPYFVRPTVDLAANEPEPLVVDTAFPASLGNVTPEGNLILHTGQFRSDLSSATGAGTQRLFTRVQGEVLYPDAPASDPVRPGFTRVEATDLGSTAFLVEVSPADLVLATYKVPAQDEWRSLRLSEAAPGIWTGFTTDTVEEYFVQAVKDGLVGSARGKGLNYEPSSDVSGAGFDLVINGTQGDNGWYVSTPTVTIADTVADANDTATFEASLDFAGYVPVAGEPPTVAVGGTGLHLLQVRRSDGDFASVFVGVDTTAPTVNFTTPFDGQVFDVGQPVEAEFDCADLGSGVASCTALDPTTLDTSPGEHTFRVHVVDFAGNEATVSVTYGAHWIFDGFFSPVDNPPMVNEVKAGQTVPLKFRLSTHDGTQITQLDAVETPVGVVVLSCDDSSPVDQLPEEGGTSKAGLVYDETDQQYVYTWTTSKSWQDSCRKVVLRTADGATHEALFRFR